jgi:GNAT superfamily N-acetyltransferase
VRQYPGVLGYTISTDPARLDRALVHRWLSEDSYWATGRPRDVMDRAIDGSLCFGLYAPDGAQAGFCRAVTDYATYAWLADVFVLDEHRGRGLGVWLVRAAVEHPDLRTLRWHLMTDDAHGLYAQFGFAPSPTPERLMVRGQLQ